MGSKLIKTEPISGGCLSLIALGAAGYPLLTCRANPFVIARSADIQCAKECGDYKISDGELRYVAFISWLKWFKFWFEEPGEEFFVWDLVTGLFAELLGFFPEYFAILALTWSNFVSLLGVFDCFAACADAFIASRFSSCSSLARAFFGLGLPDLLTWLVR